uniref:hypothetical protein n=1 Tax=Bacillaceae bacterium JMAK1 TaxID=1028381 RepID=UPI0003ABFFC2|nr:hypothetical protein [Bacillaceae bacterium JMAK1]AGQ45463.1 hypothetical protein [Bacillaceae bacterium JMAK1]
MLNNNKNEAKKRTNAWTDVEKEKDERKTIKAPAEVYERLRVHSAIEGKKLPQLLEDMERVYRQRLDAEDKAMYDGLIKKYLKK